MLTLNRQRYHLAHPFHSKLMNPIIKVLIPLTKVVITLRKSKRSMKIRRSSIGSITLLTMRWKIAYQAIQRSYFTSTTLRAIKINSMGLFLRNKGIGTGMVVCLNGKFDGFPSINLYLTHWKHSKELLTQLIKVAITLWKSKTILKIRRSFFESFTTLTMRLHMAFQVG